MHARSLGVDMRFCIVRLFIAGKPLTRQGRARQAPVTGCLGTDEFRVEGRARFITRASTVDVESPRGCDGLPALHDPVLVSMFSVAFTLAGFEIIDETTYGQAWLCQQATIQSMGPPTLQERLSCEPLTPLCTSHE